MKTDVIMSDTMPATADRRAANVLIVSEDADICAAYEPLFAAGQIAVMAVVSGEALPLLRSDDSFDLVVIDAAGESTKGLELCRRIKQDQSLYLLPVIVLLGRDHAQLHTVALRWGADDCIRVPEQDDELLYRGKNLIRIKHATDVLENSEKVIFALARMIEGKDKYTQGHVERVSAYAVQLGQQLRLPDSEIVALNYGGIVHDIGKIAVPDAVLNKPGALSDDEWQIIKRHPIVGCDLLKPLRTFGLVIPIVRWHHERPDGSGYPDGIGGDELPLLARIVAVADCFDALTTTRPYHDAFACERALDILSEDGRKGRLDPELVALLRETFLQNAATYALVGDN